MTGVQLTDAETEFTGPYLPIGGYGPHPERLRQQFEGMRKADPRTPAPSA
ncbi:hypothetical protein ACFV0C_13180 [Streptomyces sp. NPDC059568]